MKRILSWIYGLIAFLRNLLYDERVFYSYSPKVPTVCVGNLAVGGTGKTPHVEFLVRYLLSQGLQIAVLSRGYKRRTDGFILASSAATADSIGDEPRQLQLKFPNMPIAVCEDRVTAVKKLTKLFPNLDAIILDDAFQHRKLRCGYNILLTPFDQLYVNDHMLPYGRLREAPHGANRADAIVVTKCPPTMLPIERRVITTALHCPTFQELYFSSFQYQQPQPIFPDCEDMPACTPDSEFILLTAIAQPRYLKQHLEKRVVAEINFPDHHRFRPKDFSKLQSLAAQYPKAIILTTEKDAARLRDSDILPAELKPRLFYIPIAVTFLSDQELFCRKVLLYIRENRRQQKSQGQR